MANLGDLVFKIRSKNAGPFWVTIDIFCGDPAVFETVKNRLNTDSVAALYGASSSTLKRFDINELSVIKFSIPRPVVQGARDDRDMHGAGWAVLLEEFALPD
jgi:hypothetical protein